MSVKVVVGTQWGDEGKGKMVDYFASKSDIIVRFQGGDNAGHTVINDKGVFKLHIVPCGVFEKDATVLVGTGTVVNPDELLIEINELVKADVNVSKIKISSKAVVLMPYHVELDGLSEKGKTSIGTTKRGIGPCYADKMLRIALRFEDLLDLDYCKQRLTDILPNINRNLEIKGGQTFTVEYLMEKIKVWKEQLTDRIVEPVSFLNNAYQEKKNILFEGQLGVMKDIDLGIYPYVTSSNPLASYALVSSGLSYKCFDSVIGVAKAFSSAVGKGPFPTEMDEETAKKFRGSGEKPDDEFGARTGRSRRLGWLDLVIIKYATIINGLDELAICKIDKLDNVEKINVCVGYKLDGKEVTTFPNTRELERVEPIYVEMDGWMEDTTKVRKIDDLPINAKKYIKMIEDYCGVPVNYVGVGPERESLAVRD